MVRVSEQASPVIVLPSCVISSERNLIASFLNIPFCLSPYFMNLLGILFYKVDSNKTYYSSSLINIILFNFCHYLLETSIFVVVLSLVTNIVGDTNSTNTAGSLSLKFLPPSATVVVSSCTQPT